MLNDGKYNENDKWLVDALKSEPGFVLPDNFADKIAEKMSRKFAWSQYLKEFGVYVGVVAGILLILGAVQIFLAGADWKNWLDFITKNLPVVIGISVLSLFILFADRVLLRYFMHHSKIDTI